MNHYKKIFSRLSLLCALFFANGVWAQNEIYQMRSNSHPEKLQIVLDIQSIPVFNAFALSDPNRVIVDVRATAAPNYRNNLTFKKRGVVRVRTGMHGKNDVRLVLDLNKNYYWEAYALPADKKHRARLVIDIYDGRKGRKIAPSASDSIGSIRLKKTTVTPEEKIKIPNIVVLESTKKTVPSRHKKAIKKSKNKPPNIANNPPKKAPKIVAKSKKTPQRVAKLTPPSPLKQRPRIVVIDPGHGGKDSGAIGKHHTKEKNVVLQIAKRLKRRLDAIPDIKPILTRTSDRYIPLRGRLRLARKYKADLFISIHADASPNRHAKGGSVYILSNHGASSESARWLARRENAVDLKYGVDIGDYDKDIGNVLMQIQQDVTIESSYSLAKKTIQQLKTIGHIHKSRVERAGFVVLKSPDIPSMLVETAFISNPKEEKKLKTSAYQEKIAESISRGIQKYFATHPIRYR